MEDQDKRTEEQEDVEAHKKKKSVLASEDAPEADEGKGEDFELHKKKRSVLASEDAPEADEGEGEDFELHKRTPRAL